MMTLGLRTLLGPLATATGMLSFVPSAEAELSFCNDTGFSASVAIGYLGEKEWTSEGWWNADPGECVTTVVSPRAQAYYYWHALNENGEYVSEDYYFCTSDEVFTIVGDTDCKSRGYDRVSFSEIRIDVDGSAEVRLTTALAPEAPPKRKTPEPQVENSEAKETSEPSTAEAPSTDDLTDTAVLDFPLIKATLLGEWRDKNNDLVTMIIDRDKLEDQFGDISAPASWRLAGTCAGAAGQGPVMLVEYEDGVGGTLCWLMLGLDDNQLVLRAVNRTELMEFIRE
jgi:uncharacterized membrane protein